MNMNKRHIKTFVLSESENERLSEYVDKYHIKLSSVVRKLLMEYIEESELTPPVKPVSINTTGERTDYDIKQHLLMSLDAFKGNITKACKSAKVSRKKYYSLLNDRAFKNDVLSIKAR